MFGIARRVLAVTSFSICMALPAMAQETVRIRGMRFMMSVLFPTVEARLQMDLVRQSDLRRDRSVASGGRRVRWLVGSAGMMQSDGTRKAIEVHIPTLMRGTAAALSIGDCAPIAKRPRQVPAGRHRHRRTGAATNKGGRVQKLAVTPRTGGGRLRNGQIRGAAAGHVRIFVAAATKQPEARCTAADHLFPEWRGTTVLECHHQAVFSPVLVFDRLYPFLSTPVSASRHGAWSSCFEQAGLQCVDWLPYRVPWIESGKCGLRCLLPYRRLHHAGGASAITRRCRHVDRQAPTEIVPPATTVGKSTNHDCIPGDFVASVRGLTAGHTGGAGVDAAFDAIGGAHFDRSFACLASGGLLVGYGSQTMAVGREGLASAALGLARLKLWGALSFLFGGRRALFYSITARRLTHPEEFKADMATLFELLRDGAIHPVVIDRLPLAAASEVHARIDAGGLGGKIVLLPWPASAINRTTAIMK